MAYCVATDVKSFLQLPTAFSGSTNPTSTEVESLIAMNQKIIDIETGHNFDGTGTATEEFHIKPSQYSSRDGVAIFLEHRKVKEMDSDESDALTIWNGSTNEDYLANRTEGRNNDFWFNYDTGILHIRNFTFSGNRFFSGKITYRYGEASVPTDIKKACILLTASDILGSDDRSVLIPEGTSNISLLDKSDKWRKEAMRILSRRRETKAISGL